MLLWTHKGGKLKVMVMRSGGMTNATLLNDTSMRQFLNLVKAARKTKYEMTSFFMVRSYFLEGLKNK